MKILEAAKQLRSNLTETEVRLWSRLRSRQMLGHKFRRQVPIGNYVVDFACLEKKLIVELDGSQHLDQKGYDSERTEWLQSQGYKVLRFWNNQITKEMEGVLQVIEEALETSHTPLPNPPPQGGRELRSSLYSRRKEKIDRLP